MENRKSKGMIRWGLIYFALAIACGAFGAHLLEPYMDTSRTYRTACQYHFYGALLILALSANRYSEYFSMRALQIFGLGNVLFCFSLYFLAFNSQLPVSVSKIWGPITPLGGVTMIVSILWLAKSYRPSNDFDQNGSSGGA